MFFFVILISLKMFVIFINGTEGVVLEEGEVDYTKQFVKVIQEYSQHIRPVDKDCIQNSSDGGGYQNGLISTEVFNCFEKELLLILKQIKIEYVGQLQKLKNSIDGNRIETESLFNLKIQLGGILKICSLFPRCTNFIYICAPKSSLKFEIGRCHRFLCQTLPYLIDEFCLTSDAKSATYFCNIDCVNKLLNTFNLFKDSLSTGYPATHTLEIKGIDFIEKIHSFIIKIDKRKIIENSVSQSIDHIFYTLHKDDYRNRMPDILYLENKKDKQTSLNDKCFKMIIDLIDAERSMNCNSLEDADYIKKSLKYQINLSLGITIRYAVQYLGDFFQINMVKFMNDFEIRDKHSINRDLIRDWISVMFGEICKYIPLILFYIKEYMHIEFIFMDTYTYYLTFCGDNVNYVCDQCPGELSNESGDEEHDVLCIVDSMNDKMLWNFHNINRLSIPTKINTMCADLYKKHLSDTYNILVEFYNTAFVDQRWIFYLWTTYEWLSGEHFLTNGDISNSNIDKLKISEIRVGNDFMSLLDAYNIILPLNSNWSTMLDFNDTMFSILEKQFYVYVYRHVRLINLYLERNLYAGKTTVPKLRESLNWYEFAQKPFFEFLSLPTKRHPSDEITEVVKQIKTMNDESPHSIIFSSSMYIDTISWSFESLKSNTIQNLNILVVANCEEAMSLFNTFLTIIDISLPSSEDDHIYGINNKHFIKKYAMESKLICTSTLTNLFVEKLDTLHWIKSNILNT